MPKTTLPFGPQHPVLPEPLQLKLTLRDEVVIEAIPAIGYVHRGLEKLTETKSVTQNIFVVERICGICSFMHALCYCQGMEDLWEIEVPDRAKYLRVVWGELHRMHSHLLWLGLLADSFGFESLFMLAWQTREKIMDLMEMTAGARVIISVNTLGGTRRDIDNKSFDHIIDVLKTVRRDIEHLEHVFMNDYTVRYRLINVGKLPSEVAYQLGAVGPVLRASGISQDMRQLGYTAYDKLKFEPVTADEGDSYARTAVRIKEIYQSIDLINQVRDIITEGDINVAVKGRPPVGEIVSRVEQPRGECLYYMKSDGSNNLKRLRVRTPTFANIPPLLHMLPGAKLSDVPVLILTIDPCISCTER